jgi:hypothetical protein
LVVYPSRASFFLVIILYILFAKENMVACLQSWGEANALQRTRWMNVSRLQDDRREGERQKGLFSVETKVIFGQIFGENACHPERSEGSGSTGAEILRFAQDDSPDLSPVRFREALSPNISSLVATIAHRMKIAYAHT